MSVVIPESRAGQAKSAARGESDLTAPRRPARYRAQLRHDLEAVLDRLAHTAMTPQIARSFPLTDAGAALRCAETGGIAGKVILIP
jgi:NADPH:quinone reductase-like Zn-dependent oxidoreductase